METHLRTSWNTTSRTPHNYMSLLIIACSHAKSHAKSHLLLPSEMTRAAVTSATMKRATVYYLVLPEPRLLLCTADAWCAELRLSETMTGLSGTPPGRSPDIQ